MIDEWSDDADCLLARSVFGTDDPDIVRAMILDWTTKQDFGRACVSEIEFSVGAAVTVTLPDSRKALVKVWPGTTDTRGIAAQVEVQALMAARGFPARDAISYPRAAAILAFAASFADRLASSISAALVSVTCLRSA